MKTCTLPKEFLDPTTGNVLPLTPLKALQQAVGLAPFNKSVEENLTAGQLLTYLKSLPEDATELVFEDQWQALMEQAILNRQFILDISNPLLSMLRSASAFAGEKKK